MKLNIMNEGFGDGKFEAGTSTGSADGVTGNWITASANVTEALDDAVRRSGRGSLRVTRANSNGILQVFSSSNVTVPKFTVPVFPGQVVKSSCWVRLSRASASSAAFNIRHRHLDGS